ncbi:MAG: lipoyl(octanoyl) transferase LipB [Cyanobacteria bacterium P01_F01_bin.150]
MPGQVPYPVAWSWQRLLVKQRKQQAELTDLLFLLEHPPIYTLGQGATLDFLKFNPEHSDVDVCRIERGGEVTYHCLGQIVGYPILNLSRYQQDLHWYLRQLEEVIIQVLRRYDLPAERVDGLTGVWIDHYKIAAIGIKVSRWITMHGFALNVCPDLRGFEKIVPCGIADKAVGSLAQFCPNVQIKKVYEEIAIAFSQVFDIALTTVTVEELGLKDSTNS